MSSPASRSRGAPWRWCLKTHDWSPSKEKAGLFSPGRGRKSLDLLSLKTSGISLSMFESQQAQFSHIWSWREFSCAHDVWTAAGSQLILFSQQQEPLYSQWSNGETINNMKRKLEKHDQYVENWWIFTSLQYSIFTINELKTTKHVTFTVH